MSNVNFAFSREGFVKCHLAKIAKYRPRRASHLLLLSPWLLHRFTERLYNVKIKHITMCAICLSAQEQIIAVFCVSYVALQLALYVCAELSPAALS